MRKVISLRAASLVVIAACGGGFADGPIEDAPTSDAPPSCMTSILFTPQNPIAAPGTKIRVTAVVDNAPGQHTFQWFLTLNGVNATPPTVIGDNSDGIAEFPAEVEGIYRPRFRVTDNDSCEDGAENIDVNGTVVGSVNLRANVVAPAAENRPPKTETVTVQGGSTDLVEDIQLGLATTASGTVSLGGTAVAAYMKFMPTLGSDAAVETYASAAGTYSVEIRDEPHEVLIVPTTPNVPPQRVLWTSGQSAIVLQPGTQVMGTVRDPANVAIQNATVQLTIDGVPSTIGTTDASGAFTLIAPPASGPIRFEVTPPAALGLPRLAVTSDQFTLGAGAVTIRYSAGLVTRDLATTEIRRGGVLAGATVSIVGTVDDAGTITAGNQVPSDGEVRFTAVTDGNGELPTMRAPAAPLAAVIFPGAPGDHAVTLIDLTTAVPNQINAAATVTKNTTLTSSTGTSLPGAVLEAVPTGNLALAGAPSIRRTAGANGLVTIDLAPNAKYDVRLLDPNGNRGALRVVTNADNVNLPGTLALLKATIAQGTIKGLSPIPGAIVQFLCLACTGLERSRPIAEGVTDSDGQYFLAIPDPTP